MTTRRPQTQTIEDHLLRLEIEDFLWNEADLLDDFRYEEWLDLLTDDISYWMPIRRNVPSREMEGELTAEGPELSWYTDDKRTLEKRVQKIRTHVHWADEPYSRVFSSCQKSGSWGGMGPTRSRSSAGSSSIGTGTRTKRAPSLESGSTRCALSMAPGRSPDGRFTWTRASCSTRT